MFELSVASFLPYKKYNIPFLFNEETFFLMFIARK